MLLGIKLTKEEKAHIQTGNIRAESKRAEPVTKWPAHSVKRSASKPQARGHATPTATELTELEYRDLAKMFTKALPLDGEEYGDTVEDFLQQIKALPHTAKIALRTAYIFGSKARKEEREDLFQSLALAVLKKGADDERLAYAIARCDWVDWWKSQHTSEQKRCYWTGIATETHCEKCERTHGKVYGKCPYLGYERVASLDLEQTNRDGETYTLADVLAGETDFEIQMDGKLDAARILSVMPEKIRAVVERRLTGQLVHPFDALAVQEWAQTHSFLLA